MMGDHHDAPSSSSSSSNTVISVLPLQDPRSSTATSSSSPSSSERLIEMASQFKPVNVEKIDVHPVSASPSTTGTSECPPSISTKPSLWIIFKTSVQQTWLPGCIVLSIAVALVVLYYTVDSVTDAFDSIADVKDDGGYLFSFISTLIMGGLIPSVVGLLIQKYKQKPLGQLPKESAEALKECPQATPLMGSSLMWTSLVFYTLFWGYKGVEVDAFYRLQAVIFGDESNVQTIIPKVIVDQLVYNPVWSVHSINFPYLYRDCGFSWSLYRHRISFSMMLFRFTSTLLSTWIVWIPAVSIIYAFPSTLQIPLFNLISLLWALILIFLTEMQSS
eukprot:TRINITY_DN8962_c0_g1_i1.p1 TRINITY_DN8962_c0_g1~~TRINITY_DN8962_c0_g1_i1.p1  ORF type:complete len:332 (+),score=75.68 TRINITY_DN8962_c0_g1_i1:79-1074(+)